MRSRHAPLIATALISLAGAGCASVDPTATFEATQDLVAGRHPGRLHWQRGEASDALAEARVAELLASPLDPDSGAEIALLRSPELQATLEELGIAQADLAQASRLSNPGLSFDTLSGGGATQRTVAITGDLVDWLVQPLRREIAEWELERTRLAVGDALLGTLAEARAAVVDYQAALELVGRLEQLEEVDRSAAEFAQALFDAGNLTALERASVEAAWAETRAELGRASLEARRRREGVVLALGLAAAEPWQTSPLPAPPATDELDLDELESRALDDRLDLAAARWAVGVLERAVALKRKTRYFPVGVEVGVERERETDGLDLTGPTIELRLPLFDTGKASIARLTAELAQARWQLRALEARARSTVRERVAELESSRELVTLYRDSILPLRREVLERTLREYNQMLVGTFDLLRAKEEELAAERRSLEALAAYWQARIGLERAVGSPLAGPPVPAAGSRADHDHDSPGSGGPEENR